MKTVVLIVTALTIAGAAFAYDVSDGVYPEIHCKHFFYGYPTGTPVTNDMIIRDIYALSSNDTTKFADWVAYRLDCRTITGLGELERGWMNDPWLTDEETLEARPESADDYAGAYREQGYDRGHQAPLASFKGSIYDAETNYYSNITPQQEGLNRGAWVKVEGRVRDLVNAGNVVYVVTGPLYDAATPMPRLINCPEVHTVPTAYWKIVAIQPDADDYDSIRVAAFIFDQGTPRSDAVLGHLVTVDDVENRSGLEFFGDLPPGEQTRIKSGTFAAWAAEFFGP